MISTGAFTHVHLIVRDIARSASFYETVFGAEEIFRLGPDTRFLRLPGSDGVIALRQADARSDIDHFGLGFDYGDLDDAVLQVLAAGGSLVDRGDRGGGMEFAYLADPDGNVFELEPSPRTFLESGAR